MKNLKIVLIAVLLIFTISLNAQDKISKLPELIISDSTDVIPIVNNGTTKKITVSNLLKSIKIKPQTLSVVGDSLKISGGNSIALKINSDTLEVVVNFLSTANLVSGGYINSVGNISNYTAFSYTLNYIPVESNTTYIRSFGAGFAGAYYDIDTNFISYINLTDFAIDELFTTPNNCEFIRLNVKNNEVIPSCKKYIEVPKQSTDNLKYSYVEKTGLFNISTFDFSSFVISGNVLIIGNSTIASYAGAVSMASLINSTGSTIDVSVAGHTISQQLTDYNALISSVKDSINYIFVQIGLNDLHYSETAEIALIRYQNLINQINTSSPNATIICGVMIPCRQRFINLHGAINGEISYQKLLKMNEAILGNGVLAITGVDKTTDLHYHYLSDKDGNLRIEYDTGDAIHPNSAAKKIMLFSWLTGLI